MSGIEVVWEKAPGGRPQVLLELLAGVRRTRELASDPATQQRNDRLIGKIIAELSELGVPIPLR